MFSVSASRKLLRTPVDSSFCMRAASLLSLTCRSSLTRSHAASAHALQLLLHRAYWFARVFYFLCHRCGTAPSGEGGSCDDALPSYSPPASASPFSFRFFFNRAFKCLMAACCSLSRRPAASENGANSAMPCLTNSPTSSRSKGVGSFFKRVLHFGPKCSL